MKKISSVFLLLTMCLMLPAKMSAEDRSLEPFVPTTIEDGAFAPDTHWYTMSVKGLLRQASRTNDNSISLANVSELALTDAHLWCFVGNAEEGYKVYNKAAGAGKCLAAERNAVGNNVAPSFVSEEGIDLDVYQNRWLFKASASPLNAEEAVSIYMEIDIDGDASFALNDYANKGQLKFWDGRGIGSTMVLQLPSTLTYTIDMNNGSFSSREDNDDTDEWRARWNSAFRQPGISLSRDAYGMRTSENGINVDLSKTSGDVYTLEAEEGYVITGFSLNFSGAEAAFTISTPDGQSATAAAGETATFAAGGFYAPKVVFSVTTESDTAQFVTTSDFVVTTTKFVAPDPARTVKVFDNDNSSVPYRIPALAKTADGKLILVVDYRYSHADIGNGPIDLRYKISQDNGRTWSEEYTNLGDGNDAHSAGNQWDYAFGDPSIVADRENPDEVLVMAVGGHVGYFSSTYDNPQHVVCFRSHDGGSSWTKGDTLTYRIYDLYQGSITGKTKGIFLTSGKIMQSRYVKAGNFYRLYIAHPCRGEAGQADYVIYSDDFGETWDVLGHNPLQKASTGSDESKIEELPDGSVLISSRNQSGGRVMNVFSYTNSAKGEGVWGTEGVPDLMKAGMVNACNGEILVVPVRRSADDRQMYLALQSVPQSSSRVQVGFYYKEIAEADDYLNGSSIASEWKKGLCVTNQDACYSTMQMMDNDSIAFVYEESGSNGGYNIIFKALSVDTITGGAYTYDKSFTDRTAYFEQGAEIRSNVEVGTAVGMLKSTDALNAAQTSFEADKTQANMEAVYDAVAGSGAERNVLQNGRRYFLRNCNYTGRFLNVWSGSLRDIEGENGETAVFLFEPTTEEGKYYIKNEATGSYICATPALYTAVATSTLKAEADSFRVVSNADGHTYLASCSATAAGYPALHDDNHDRIVGWTTVALPSNWFVEPVEPEEEIDAVSAPFATADKKDDTVFDLQGRRSALKGRGVFIRGGRKYLR